MRPTDNKSPTGFTFYTNITLKMNTFSCFLRKSGSTLPAPIRAACLGVLGVKRVSAVRQSAVVVA